MGEAEGEGSKGQGGEGLDSSSLLGNTLLSVRLMTPLTCEHLPWEPEQREPGV